MYITLLNLDALHVLHNSEEHVVVPRSIDDLQKRTWYAFSSEKAITFQENSSGDQGEGTSRLIMRISHRPYA